MNVKKGTIYQASPWLIFREKILQLDEYCCVRCGKNAQNRSLQVHHKYYIQGKMPWEYPFSACLVLCQFCHAQYHGKVRPRKGWQYMGYHTCKKGREKCGNCSTLIKHCYFLFHPQWGTLLVGEICCNQLTQTSYASAQRRKELKKTTYLDIQKWKKTAKGNWVRRYKGRWIVVFVRHALFYLKIDHRFGRKAFTSLVNAQSHAFDIIQEGILDVYEALHAQNRSFFGRKENNFFK